MTNHGNEHWAFDDQTSLQTRIASDFLAQIEKIIADKDWSHADLAKALDVTEGRVSQVFNNPGNLTLRSMTKFALSVNMLVSVVAYKMNDHIRQSGPVGADVFEACWSKLGKPMTHWDLEEKWVVDGGAEAGRGSWPRRLVCLAEPKKAGGPEQKWGIGVKGEFDLAS
jgi:hypothetical protein